MTLRLSEEEYAELMRRRGEGVTDSLRRFAPPPSEREARGNGRDRGKTPHPPTASAPSPQGEGKAAAFGREDKRGAEAAAFGREPGGEGKGRRLKYGNQRVEIDGKKFDSKHEAEVYGELMLRKRAGELKLVLRQVAFDLPGGIRYFADFVTVDFAGNIEVIDAKSEATRKNRVYINKKKQVLSEWGFEIKEV